MRLDFFSYIQKKGLVTQNKCFNIMIVFKVYGIRQQVIRARDDSNRYATLRQGYLKVSKTQKESMVPLNLPKNEGKKQKSM